MKLQFCKISFVALIIPAGFWICAASVPGQSPDHSLPTPVLSREIVGRIAALDLGDARLTQHFYAFEGTPGDLLITIDSRNLNGDVDIFTAITFRPLVKTALYANSQAGEVTKGLYLRTRQILILRVEARTPNDEEGSYRIRFGGSFEPFSGGIPVATNTEAPEDSSSPTRGSRRLSSSGATIAEPSIETPPAKAEPSPAAATEKPAGDTAAVKKTTPTKTSSRPNRSNARNSRGRGRPARPKPAASDKETVKSAAKTGEAKPEESKTEPAKKTGEEKTEAAKTNPQELPPPGAHLIIESKDGTKIDRPMSTVRRVVVEGGMIVIVLKTGHIERIPMSGVARMAIEP